MLRVVSEERDCLGLGTKPGEEILPWGALGLPRDACSMWGSKDADLGPVAAHIEGAWDYIPLSNTAMKNLVGLCTGETLIQLQWLISFPRKGGVAETHFNNH